MTGKPSVPTAGNVGTKEWFLKLAQVTNNTLHGHMNTGGLVTLTPSSGTTLFIDGRIAVDSTVVLVPTTANAAAELANGTLWMAEAGRVNGEIVITHANNAQADRTFRFVIIG